MTRGLLIGLLLLLGAPWTAAAAEPEVTVIRFGDHGSWTRVVVAFDRRVEPAVSVRDEPPRLVLDLPEVRFRPRPDPLAKVRGLVTGHRFGRLEPGRARIVIDLRRPFTIARQLLLPPSGASREWRFVLDLEPLSKSTPPAVAAAPPPFAEPPAMAVLLPRPRPPAAPQEVGNPALPARIPAAPSERLAPTLPSPHAALPTEPVAPAERAASRPEAAPGPTGGQPMLSFERAGPLPAAPAASPPETVRARPAPAVRRPVIVLDPGHGGVDPGTIGVNGELEKDVTLEMARTLARVLREGGRYEVFLTREDDRFLALRERVAIARRLRADLFISLHADSIEDRRVAGASVYTLSEQASDAEAERLARKENRADVLAGVDLSVQDEIVAGILIDLARRDTNNKSIIFAERLVTELDGVAPLLRRHRRYAGFAVLKSPDTPSVLVELGYLSNPRDAARLSDPRHRERLAQAIARAIDHYFTNLRPLL